MNKEEFLEILKDYLKKDFSQDEVSDILRDYEEYFVDGIIEGKSDMEIIQALGSPKAIADELISEIRKKGSNTTSRKNSIDDKIKLIKLRAKENYNKGKIYVSEKLTPNIEGESHKKDRKWIQVVLVILSLFLVIPSFIILGSLLLVGIALVASLVIYVGSVILTFNFISSTPQLMGLFIFASIAFIGGEILAWQIYILAINLCRKIVKSYINWIRTRNIYINASKKKEEYEKKDLEDLSIKYYDEDDFEDDDEDFEDDGKGDDRYE